MSWTDNKQFLHCSSRALAIFSTLIALNLALVRPQRNHWLLDLDCIVEFCHSLTAEKHEACKSTDTVMRRMGMMFLSRFPNGLLVWILFLQLRFWMSTLFFPIFWSDKEWASEILSCKIRLQLWDSGAACSFRPSQTLYFPNMVPSSYRVCFSWHN